MITAAAFKSSVLVSLEFRCPGNTRQAGLDDVEVDADKASLRLSKELLKSAELKAIRRVASKLKKYLRAKAVPGNYFRSGCYLLSRSLVSDVYERYSTARSDLAAAVETFLDVYPTRKAEAQARLRSKFDAQDYPTAQEFRDGVALKLGVIEAATPDDLSPSIKADQEAMAAAEWRSTVDEVRSVLRGSLAAYIQSAIDKLTPDETGKRKGITDKAAEKINAFLSMFENRDVTNDTAVRELVAKGREILSECDVRALKKQDSFAAQVKGQFESLKGDLDKIILADAAGGRKFTFEDVA